MLCDLWLPWSFDILFNKIGNALEGYTFVEIKKILIVDGSHKLHIPYHMDQKIIKSIVR